MRHLISGMLFLFAVPLLAQNPLAIPDTLSGDEMQLTLREGTVQFFPGTITQTMGVNGNILGPTIILRKNQDVVMHVTNSLPDPTTLHWHGMHVSAQNDGGPHTFMLPGETWSPHFTVLDRASTYWYHPHLHMKTNLHVSKGIAGMIIVRDEEEGALELPRTYGIDEFPVVVQTKDFDAAQQIVIDTHEDETILVNATIDPFLQVPAQVVRLRLLNGATERAFLFGLTDNRVFYQIASDGGLLQAPVSLTRMLLAPGERAEILVDFSGHEGQEFSLRNYGAEIPSGIYGAAQLGMGGMGGMQTLPGYGANPLNGSNFDILLFRVSAATSQPVTRIPSHLAAIDQLQEGDADKTRPFTFTSQSMGPRMLEGPFLINGTPFSMNTINEYIPFNNIEIWELRNQTPLAHPFHIHDVQFRILDINGTAPPANMAGNKDVVLVPGGNSIVRFITQFNTHYDDVFPYMYHCHMLTHEDNGMMGQFIVSSPVTAVAQENSTSSAATLSRNYPNPFLNVTTIGFSLPHAGSVRVEVFDMLGRSVRTLWNGWKEAGSHEETFDATGLPEGVYTCTLLLPDGHSQARQMILLGENHATKH